MARGHGRILTSIWDDADFLALDERQQRLYLFLISQPNLNHAGLLPLTLRRWSRKAHGLTSAELEKRLQALESARFIVMDDDTEELLIRSFVRNDGVWKQPKVMGAMVSGALEISSRRLRGALLAEMDRVPLDELSDEPTKSTRGTGPSIRSQVAEHIETLRKAFGTPEPDPTRRGSGTPSAPPSGTPSDTPAEGGPEGSTRGRAATHVRAAPALSPSPSPIPSPVEEGGGGGSDRTEPTAMAKQQRPDGLHLIPDDFHLNDTMRRWVNATYPGLDPEFETQQFISYWRGEGRRKRNWHEAWRKWVADSAKRASERATRPPLRAVSGGWQPYREPTPEDRAADLGHF
ncbi:hypothetical protein [Streptomyces adelaidensis]|uniref:hypothetical protein n=1 Tax=Streptomyces adelaidensis TaxID=2796465 RepID=UPI001903A890|nr:hypothetical protein [Streptomyces adelaidensis]